MAGPYRFTSNNKLICLAEDYENFHTTDVIENMVVVPPGVIRRPGAKFVSGICVNPPDDAE